MERWKVGKMKVGIMDNWNGGMVEWWNGGRIEGWKGERPKSEDPRPETPVCR